MLIGYIAFLPATPGYTRGFRVAEVYSGFYYLGCFIAVGLVIVALVSAILGAGRTMLATLRNCAKNRVAAAWACFGVIMLLSSFGILDALLPFVGGNIGIVIFVVLGSIPLILSVVFPVVTLVRRMSKGPENTGYEVDPIVWTKTN